ncbi:MAG: class I SAM-dependent methyltransferase [Deltaproteobacteria bacterium]|nr:class I SAM-dependent methyltransferase [Deltaproteobacteria bacterium]
MTVEFSAHNIRLDDGTFTKPDSGHTMEAYPRFVSARRILETVFPGDKRHLRLADLGCLEGGFAVEFARMGFQVLGVEVRDANFAACNYVKSKTSLPNLVFAKDNAWNIATYGVFDVVFCCGLLYHLDRPKEFLETVSSVTKKLVIVQTHFSIDNIYGRLPILVRNVLGKTIKSLAEKHNLARVTVNEGLPGRWYTEFANDESFSRRGNSKWASWDNRRSFWIQREYLLQAIQDVGFDLVIEQFDGLGPNIAESMLRGFYRAERRGTFIGIKTKNSLKNSMRG